MSSNNYETGNKRERKAERKTGGGGGNDYIKKLYK